MFGLWSAPSVAETHQESLAPVGAQAVAIATTLLVLTLADAPHAPAGATALPVASGIARPGPELISLIIGLAIVLAVAPLLARLPRERHDTATSRRRGDSHGVTIAVTALASSPASHGDRVLTSPCGCRPGTGALRRCRAPDRWSG